MTKTKTRAILGEREAQPVAGVQAIRDIPVVKRVGGMQVVDTVTGLPWIFCATNTDGADAWTLVPTFGPGRYKRAPSVTSSTTSSATLAGHDHGGTNATSVQTLMNFPPTSLPAAGVTVHAQDIGGGALNLVAGFTIPLPARTLTITRSAAGPGSVNYVVTWNMPSGTFPETIAVASGGSTTSVVAGQGIVSITTSVDPVSTTDFVTGPGFSIGASFTAAGAVLSCDGVRQAIASYEAASGTIVPTTAPDAAKAYAFSALMNPHSHTIPSVTPTITGSAHTHAIP